MSSTVSAHSRLPSLMLNFSNVQEMVSWEFGSSNYLANWHVPNINPRS